MGHCCPNFDAFDGDFSAGWSLPGAFPAASKIPRFKKCPKNDRYHSFFDYNGGFYHCITIDHGKIYRSNNKNSR